MQLSRPFVRIRVGIMGTHLRNPSLGNKLIIMPLFFFLPGYVRLLLLFIGFFFYDRAYILLPLYSIAAILDSE